MVFGIKRYLNPDYGQQQQCFNELLVFHLISASPSDLCPDQPYAAQTGQYNPTMAQPVCIQCHADISK